MLRQLSYALIVMLAVAGCASDEEMSTETGATGATTAPGGGAGSGSGIQGGPLSGRPGGGGTVSGSSSAIVSQAEQQLTQSGDTVFFGFDRFDLDERAQRTLDQQASVLLRYPQVNVMIEGHADERGTREYNLALGERRANAVKEYLSALGISPARMRSVSYGEERPLVVGSNEAAWAQNRRAVTIAVGAAAGS